MMAGSARLLVPQLVLLLKILPWVFDESLEDLGFIALDRESLFSAFVSAATAAFLSMSRCSSVPLQNVKSKRGFVFPGQ